MTLTRTEAGPALRRTLRNDVQGELLYATWFSVLAAVVIGIASFDPAADRRLLLGALGLVIAGYFLGGVLSGCAFWALRPLRRGVVGWALTGFIIGALVYGAVGLTGVLGYYAGINLLELASAEEGWKSLPILSPTLGLLVGAPYGVYQWYKQKDSPSEGAV